MFVKMQPFATFSILCSTYELWVDHMKHTLHVPESLLKIHMTGSCQHVTRNKRYHEKCVQMTAL